MSAGCPCYSWIQQIGDGTPLAIRQHFKRQWIAVITGRCYGPLSLLPTPYDDDNDRVADGVINKANERLFYRKCRS